MTSRLLDVYREYCAGETFVRVHDAGERPTTRAVVGTRYEDVTVVFFFQAEDGIRDLTVTGVQTCALPISSKVARVTTPPVRCPSSSHCRSVCPERSPSNWIRHWTRTSAELESASRLNRTGTPASCHRWNALRTASRKAGWKLATVVGGKYTRTGGDTRLSQRCRMESVLAATISFKYVLPALARIRRRISERARGTM